jgi:DNA-binding MarR family transcriptional regulator
MSKLVDQVNHNPGRPADDVLETMHAIMHLYRSAQHRSLRDGPNDLAHMEVKALGFFARHPGATQSELVAHSGRDKAQVARQIRALRERGLLEAKEDEQDRRLKEQALQGFTEQDKAALLDLLARVRANLRAMPD